MSRGSAVFNSRYSRAVLSKSNWENHKPFIQKHYIENDKTLEDLKVLLKEDRGVEVTKHQLEYRCRRWGLRKNNSQSYPRHYQHQKVLKFPPGENDKTRSRQKGSSDIKPDSTEEMTSLPSGEESDAFGIPTASSYSSRDMPFSSGAMASSAYSTTSEGSAGYLDDSRQGELSSSPVAENGRYHSLDTERNEFLETQGRGSRGVFSVRDSPFIQESVGEPGPEYIPSWSPHFSPEMNFGACYGRRWSDLDVVWSTPNENEAFMASNDGGTDYGLAHATWSNSLSDSVQNLDLEGPQYNDWEFSRSTPTPNTYATVPTGNPLVYSELDGFAPYDDGQQRRHA